MKTKNSKSATRKLDKQVSKNGFIYKLVRREGDVAMYQQLDKDNITHSLEVFRVKTAEACTAPNGKKVPRREVFPSNEAFGRSAFSLPNVELATKVFNEMLDGTPSVGAQSADEVKAAHKAAPKVARESRAQVKKLNGHTVRWYGKYRVVVNAPGGKPIAPKPFLMKALKSDGSETMEQMLTKLFA